MHLIDPEVNMMGSAPIVSGTISLAIGAALAAKTSKSQNISVTYFGDGAANQGQVYETYNMSALWKLPVLFVIENNMYGMGTSVKRSSAGKSLAGRGDAYGIKNKVVNGMDVLEVRDAAMEAVDYCRSGKGPFILEMKTYRYRGHSMSDPAKYRTREEVDDARKSGPIKTLQNLILSLGVKEEELKNVDDNIRKVIHIRFKLINHSQRR